MEVKIEEEKRKWKNAKENARGNDEEKIQKKNALWPCTGLGHKPLQKSDFWQFWWAEPCMRQP